MHLLLPDAAVIEYETLIVCQLYQVQLCMVHGWSYFIGYSSARSASVLAFKFIHVGCMVILTSIELTLRIAQAYHELDLAQCAGQVLISPRAARMRSPVLALRSARV